MAIDEQQAQSADKLWSALEKAFGDEDGGANYDDEQQVMKETDHEIPIQEKLVSNVVVESTEAEPVQQLEQNTKKDFPSEALQIPNVPLAQPIQPSQEVEQDRTPKEEIQQEKESVFQTEEGSKSSFAEIEKNVSSPVIPVESVFANTPEEQGEAQIMNTMEDTMEENLNGTVAQNTPEPQIPIKREVLKSGWIIKCKRDYFEIAKTNEKGEEVSRFFTPRSGGETIVDIGNVSVRATSDEIELRG